MTNNCLVTKLKESVANNKLLKMDEIMLHIKHSSNSNSLTILYEGINSASVKVLDSSYNLIGSINSTAYGSYQKIEVIPSALDNDTEYLIFPSKQYMYQFNDNINSNVTEFTYNLSDFIYSPLDSITLRFADPGKFASDNVLKWSNTLTVLHVNELNPIKFSLIDLGKLQVATLIDVVNPVDDGTLESFCETLYANSISRNRNIRVAGSQYISFHNIALGHDSGYKHITLNTSGVLVGTTQGGSELGSYNGTTWTYNS